ncbi:hypothetical protein BDF19DRAFT_447820 [Syncephalis fuscata]|nr:hypothetical protein BDF19DRAFT_447820 [Syncephalis fuscata]
MGKPSRLLQVPPEIANHVLLYLSWREALQLASIVPLYRRVLRGHPGLWRRYYREEFLCTEQDKVLGTYLQSRIETEQLLNPATNMDLLDTTSNKFIDWEQLFRRQILLHKCWRQGRYTVRPIELSNDASSLMQSVHPCVLTSNADYSVVFLRPESTTTGDGQLYIVYNTPDPHRRPIQLAPLGRPGLLNKLTFFPMVPRLPCDNKAIVLIIRTSSPMQLFLCAWNPLTGQRLMQTSLPGVTSASMTDRRERWLLLSLDGDRWRLYDLRSTIEGQPAWSAPTSNGAGFCIGYDSTATDTNSSANAAILGASSYASKDWVELVKMSKSRQQPGYLVWHSFICCHDSDEGGVENNSNSICLAGIVRVVRLFNWRLLRDGDRLVVSVRGQHGEQALVVASRSQNSVLWSRSQCEAPSLPIYLPSYDFFVMTGWIEELIKDDTGRITSRRRTAGHLVLNARSGSILNTLTNLSSKTLKDIGLGAFLLVQPSGRVSNDDISTNKTELLDVRTSQIVSQLSGISPYEFTQQTAGPTHFISYDSTVKQLYLHDFAMDSA